MNLSQNFLAVRETVQEKILNLSSTVTDFCMAETGIHNKLFDMLSIREYAAAYTLGLSSEEETYDILQQFALEHLGDTKFAITLPVQPADEVNEAVSVPGIIHWYVTAVNTELEDNYWIHFWITVLDASDNVIDNIELVNFGGEDHIISNMISIDPDLKIEGYDFSLHSLLSTFKDTLTSCYIVEAVLSLYNESQLTISNLVAKLQGVIDLSSAVAAQIIDIITNNLTAILGNPLALITIIKEILKYLFSFRSNGDTFVYPIDSYHVSNEIVIGWDVVVNVVTTMVGAVIAIWAPVVGMAVNLIGNGVRTLVNAIDQNQSADPLYPEYADFNGLGQNVKRGYVYGLPSESINFDGQFQAHAINTPLFTSLVYNAPKKDGLHRDVYPTQEFIVPILPVHANGWKKLANIISSGGAVAASYSWIDVPVPHTTTYVHERSVGVATTSATISSSDTRISRVQEYMQWINDHPDLVWMPNTKEDSQRLIRFATWLNYVLLQASIGSLSDEYYSLNGLVYNGSNEDEETPNPCQDIIGEYDPDVIRTKEFLLQFSGLCLLVADVLEAHAYDPDGIATMSSYLDLYLQYGTLEDNEVHWRTHYLTYITWMELINNILLGELLGVNAYAPAFCADGIKANTPYSITNYLSSSSFTPSIVPPSHTLSIWARLAITTTIVAAAAITALVAYTKARKVAIRSFSKFADKARDGYLNYVNGEDSTTRKKAYKQWKFNQFMGNSVGSIFRLGSIDSVNNWVNSPAATNLGVMDKIQELSDNTASQSSIDDPNIEFSLADVLTLIKGSR